MPTASVEMRDDGGDAGAFDACAAIQQKMRVMASDARAILLARDTLTSRVTITRAHAAVVNDERVRVTRTARAAARQRAAKMSVMMRALCATQHSEHDEASDAASQAEEASNAEHHLPHIVGIAREISIRHMIALREKSELPPRL